MGQPRFERRIADGRVTYSIKPVGPPYGSYIWLGLVSIPAFLFIFWIAALFLAPKMDPGGLLFLSIVSGPVFWGGMLALDLSRRAPVSVTITDRELQFGSEAYPLADVQGFMVGGPKAPGAPEPAAHALIVPANEIGIGLAILASPGSGQIMTSLTRHVVATAVNTQQCVRVVLPGKDRWRRVVYGLDAEGADLLAAEFATTAARQREAVNV